MSSLLGVPVDAAYHLVSGLTGILTPALGGLAAVAAIVAFTMAVRLVLMPLSLRALRGQAAQARLAPQLAALRQRYGKQPERLQREMAALYKREGTSMFAGFAPLLLQWPFLSVMYLLFRSPTVSGTANTLLTHDLFGVPLGAHWLSGAGPLDLASAHGVVFVGLFALLAGLCWLSARVGRLMTAQATGVKPTPGTAAAATAAGGPGLLVRALPYLTVVIAAFAPLAAGIYLLTTLAWSLAERMLYSRPKGWTALSTDHGTRGRRFPPERPSLTHSDPRRRRTASVE
ncbi:MAG TPA: membrane protein insertase YidC [Streptosporangiaceae bacterium]|nr:membrane protein insertase YidC [Streptosporangiaceae bacterium]